MTTIKSTLRGSRAQLVINESDPADKLAVGETSLMVITGTGAGNLVHVPTADLAAALGLHTQEAWDRAHQAAKAERDALRTELDELNTNPWKARYQKARNELDEAEATIARVRHLRDVSGDTVGVEELDAALDPKPASKQVILTADMAGVKVNGYDFTKGVLVTLPAEDADRLISAGLAKETTDD